MLPEATVSKFATLAGISAVAAAVRVALSEDERHFKGYMIRLVLGLGAGLTVGFVIDGYGGETYRNAAVSLAAITAKELLTGVVKLVQLFADNPKAVLDWFMRKGGKDAKQKD